MEPEKPTVELNNLVKCSTLSQSQSSLMSSSSVGSVRGDEGGLYTDFYGDYCPLFDNRQGADSASLQGKTTTTAVVLLFDCSLPYPSLINTQIENMFLFVFCWFIKKKSLQNHSLTLLRQMMAWCTLLVLASLKCVKK